MRLAIVAVAVTVDLRFYFFVGASRRAALSNPREQAGVPDVSKIEPSPTF